ncbi:MAG TPA: YfbU family protein [Oculatellaceae cyanobacterium]
MDKKNIKLTPVERLLLANQFRQMMEQNGEDRLDSQSDLQRKLKIVENGYTEHYDELFDSFSSEEDLSSELQQELLEILDVVSRMGCDEHGNPSPINLEYDANAEGREFWYMKFLQNRHSDYQQPQNWSHVNVAGCAGPKLAYYRRLKSAFYEVTRGKLRFVTDEEKKQIKDKASYVGVG